MEITIDQFDTYADGLDHPEGLAFDRDGILWAGGELGQVYQIPERGRVREITNVGGFCLGLAFSSSDDLYICNWKLGSIIKVEKTGRSSLFADRAGAHKLSVPNYGVFDSSGNLYVSDSGDWFKRSGCVVRFDRKGRGKVFLEGPQPFPNGLALSADERFLLIAQSHTYDVLQVEIRADGSAGHREVYAGGLERVPDGMAFDLEGNLYVGCYASDSIFRISPKREVKLLAYDRDGTTLARPTNLAFGGQNRDELFIANLGRWHISHAKLGVKGQPLANQK